MLIHNIIGDTIELSFNNDVLYVEINKEYGKTVNILAELTKEEKIELIKLLQGRKT